MSVSTVSVIITCYNEGSYVPDAVKSVLTQTWVDRVAQIIIVDDGSAEETQAVVRKVAESDSRIKAVFQSNQGLPAARNSAIVNAIGDYVAILDADDLWMPKKLELQLPGLDANPAIGLSYTDLFLVDPVDTEKRRLVRCRSLQPDTTDALEQFFVEDAPIIPSCAILRRSVFATVGPFDPTYILAEDTEMWIRVLGAFPCRHVGEPTLLKRARLDSLGANELRRLPYNERLTLQAVQAYPQLAPLAGKRRARRLVKTAQYLEQAGRRAEARSHCWQAIKADPFFARSYALLLLSLSPAGWSQGVQRSLRKLKHG